MNTEVSQANNPMGLSLKESPRTLENAVVRLLKNRPFYGHLLLGLRRRIQCGRYPLGITLNNGTPVISIDPDKFASYPSVEQQALLEHALKHLLHLHPLRVHNRHWLTWDVATDLAINSSIAGMPAVAPRPEHFGLDPGLAAEEYARLLAPRFELGNLAGEGIGHAGQAANGEQSLTDDEQPRQDTSLQPLDDHTIWNDAAGTPGRLAEQAIRDLVRQAFLKAHREVPGDVGELVQGWLAPPSIPWHTVLRQFVGNAGRFGRQGSWQREHRRFEHATPGTRKRRQLNLLVAIDVSDSTDRSSLREAFARELLQIARGRNSSIIVLYAHSRIRRIETFRRSQVAAEVVHGGGFTDLRPVFAYARQMQSRPAAIIYLTDGEGPAPETMEIPTLWVLTPEGRKPTEWGVELRMSTE